MGSPQYAASAEPVPIENPAQRNATRESLINKALTRIN
jgi:hypothetical protein